MQDTVRLRSTSRVSHNYIVTHAGLLRLPVELNRGLNHVILTPLAATTNSPEPPAPAAQQALKVSSLTIAGHY